jgi:hypothetical protein
MNTSTIPHDAQQRLGALRRHESDLMGELADITAQIGRFAGRVETIGARLRAVRRDIRAQLDAIKEAAA